MAAVIPVLPQKEPDTFDSLVRQPGLKWIREAGLDPEKPAPAKADIEPCWRACLPELHRLYGGICAYLCIFFEPELGAGSVDHFVAKSKSKLSLAYEWDNYRLACVARNRLKREFDDVLDPFEVQEGMFHLDLITGRIFPNPDLPAHDISRVGNTIKRLKLDSAGCRRMRQRHYDEYLRHDLPPAYLHEKYPFRWYEANRQGLL